MLMSSLFFLLSDWSVNMTGRAGAAILDHEVAWEWKLRIAVQGDRVSWILLHGGLRQALVHLIPDVHMGEK